MVKTAIIYKICCNDLNVPDVYVGFTTNFASRKWHHKSSCNNSNSRQYDYKIYKFIRDNGGWENFSIVQIEKFEFDDKLEMRARERYWYEQLNSTLNTKYPNRENPEYQREYQREYRANNREQIIQYRAENREHFNQRQRERRANERELYAQKKEEQEDAKINID